MTDQYCALNATVIKALSDKVYDKRKTAASQIETIIRDLDAKGDVNQIKKAILVVTNLIQTGNAHSSKGGFIGLTAIGLGLGTESIEPYVMDLVKPLFTGFKNSSPTVRFYATEALYNVCKVTKESVLVLFNEIFSIMIDLANDTDDTVKNGADLLNQVMKDIIMTSKRFDLPTFVPVLREKLYVHETAAQGAVVSWVSTIIKVPGANLVPYLPNLLDGLFILLSSSNFSVKKATEVTLGELIYHVERNPHEVYYKEMISIVVIHAKSQDPKVQAMALLWSSRFVSLSGRDMVPFISGMLNSVIPCIALDDEEHCKCKSSAEELSSMLIDLIKAEDDYPMDGEDDGFATIVEENDNSVNESYVVVGRDSEPEEDDSNKGFQPEIGEVKLVGIIEVLKKQLLNTPVACKTTALRWIYQLNNKLPLRMHRFKEKLFDVLLKTISDPSEAVVLLGLRVIAQISSMNNSSVDVKLLNEGQYYRRFMYSLLKVFYNDRILLNERGPHIIRELCVLLPAECIYEFFSTSVQNYSKENADFVFEIVNSLSSILLTSTELFGLRRKMRNLEYKENYDLFVSLYKAWCYCPVSALTLCLLAERYDTAEIIVNHIGSLHTTIKLLVELDKLVQLIESPTFSFLRLRLVSPEEHPALIKTLYGILMILPQTDTFHKFRTRMNCMPPFSLNKISSNTNLKSSVKDMELIEHFRTVQNNMEHFHLAETRSKLEAAMKMLN